LKVTVFGSGAWGTAIALLLYENGNDVSLWAKFTEEAKVLQSKRENPLLGGVTIHKSIQITSDINEAVKNTQAAIIAVPSFAVRETVDALRGRLCENCLIICMSKGIEKDTSMLFTDIIRTSLGSKAKIASVSGPTHAEEVSRKIPSACVAAAEDIEVARLVQDILFCDYLRVYTSTDVIGVELSAALKNVIALSAGVCDGLGYGDNTMAMLMTRGLSEMARLCVAMGGKKETLAGLAGLGDLIVTCVSQHSRNRRAGVLIGQGKSAEQAMREVGAVVESYYASMAAYKLSQELGVDMPICAETYKVVHENKDPQVAMKELMSRGKKSETGTGEERWVTS
jgi:glycerol-3-phosphate dehydrogenase (NAD(P)+)